jgi:predicted RNA-binding protein with PIN domain
MIILGHGALRISARSFRLEVDEAIQTLRNYLEQQT